MQSAHFASSCAERGMTKALIWNIGLPEALDYNISLWPSSIRHLSKSQHSPTFSSHLYAAASRKRLQTASICKTSLQFKGIMQLPSVAIILSAFLSFGAKLGEGQNSFTERAICSGPKCSGSSNAIDEGGKPGISPAVPSPPATAKGINCEVLLRQNAVNCSGLSAKTCDLITWMHAVSA